MISRYIRYHEPTHTGPPTHFAKRMSQECHHRGPDATESAMPEGTQGKLEQWCRAEHDVALTIIDGFALSELLADEKLPGAW